MSRPIDWHELAAVILERGQLPLCELALAVHRRKLDVLHALREGPFVRVGRTKASRWDIASPVRSFDARSFVELHPDWSLEWANEVVAWLVDVGFVSVSASREHLHRLFDGLEGFVALGMGFGSSFRDGAYKHRSFAEDFFGWPDQEESLLAKVAEHVESADIYVCPLLRKIRSRKSGSGAFGRFAWADLDKPAPSGWERALLGPSSFVIDSGRGQHAYVALSDCLGNHELEDLNRRLARALDADSGWSETKYLRLAGTLNHKPRAQLGDSAPVDFLEVLTGERDWTVDQLRELLPVSWDVYTQPNGDGPIEPVMPANVPEHLLARLDEEPADRSTQTLRFVAACVDAGLDDAAVMALALEHRPTKEKYGSDDPDRDRRASEIERALRKVRPGRDALGTHLASGTGAGVNCPGASRVPYVVGTQGRDAPTTAPVVDVPEPSLEAEAAEAFAAVEEASAEPLLGDEENTILARGGSAVYYGDGGAGKTTSGLDRAFHLCAGVDWLGLRVAKPLRVFWIENEGPRGKFREKVRRKLAAWDGPSLEGRLHVLSDADPSASSSLVTRLRCGRLA